MKLNAKQLSSHLLKNLAPCYLVTGDEHLLLADGFEEFARATAGLLDDPQRAARLGAAGQRNVEQRYGWERLGSELAELWSRIGSARS